MARPLRLSFENAVYHITARGNRREPIFYADQDRRVFLEKINETFLKYSFVCFTYCLMDNHYHLFVKTPLANITQGMHYLNTSYVNWFKARHKVAGVIFQGRYKSILVDENNYGVHLSAYIHLNPSRAGIVENPREYPWSSYLTYVNGETSPVVLDTDFILGQFDNDKIRAQKKYETYVTENRTMENPMQKSFKGLALGSNTFIDSIKKQVKTIESTREIPNSKIMTSHTAEEIIQQVMTEFSVSREQIFRKKRGNFFRQMTIFLLRQFTPLGLREIGELFQMDYSAVSQACRRYAEKVQKQKR